MAGIRDSSCETIPSSSSIERQPKLVTARRKPSEQNVGGQLDSKKTMCTRPVDAHLRMAVDGGVMKWSVILQTSHVDIGSGIQQLSCNVEPAVITRLVQCCPA